MSRLLELLELSPCAESVDYVQNKTQFHLHTLPSEQRHKKTWNVSFSMDGATQAGLRTLLLVDDDVLDKLTELAEDPTVLEQAVDAVVRAILSDRKIYIYGCGATGRLAKQMESGLWRPFWRKLKNTPLGGALLAHLPDAIEDRLIGEMTGGDRALVSSLEGFEDLQLIGKLQLEDRGVARGDVVFAVTEGGETSSVIGTILAGLAQYGELDESRQQEASARLYFVYNNPDEALRPFERSRLVIDNPAITKICLATGPQAITGSTRLQAATSETFVLGVLLEEAIYRLISPHLGSLELRRLGFSEGVTLRERLLRFGKLRQAVDAAAPVMAKLTALEAETYRKGRFVTYFAKCAAITVFIDCAERSPTFRLHPLDKISARERRSWVQVWTEAADASGAWRVFLGRGFRGLEQSRYEGPFREHIEDPYLRRAALRGLENAGSDQQTLYDFSFSSANIERGGPQADDLGVLVLLDAELAELRDPSSSHQQFFSLFRRMNAKLGIVVVSSDEGLELEQLPPPFGSADILVRIASNPEGDPLTLSQQVAMKTLLNAHSTAVMALCGRVVGNTMTSVSPSNLKLIGRATHLIRCHVNDTLSQAEWSVQHGPTEPVSFAEVNAVLWDAMAYVGGRRMGQTPEVALSIIRILEGLARQANVSWKEAATIFEHEGLAAYLSRKNPRLV